MFVYTDGSSLENGTKYARAGFGVWFGDGDERNISKPLKGSVQTNNRAELTAILEALKMLDMCKLTMKDITIVSDSQYSIKCVTVWIMKWEKNNWLTAKKTSVKNKDLITQIYILMKEFVNLNYRYIKAHTGKSDKHSIGNAMADKLAVSGASNTNK